MKINLRDIPEDKKFSDYPDGTEFIWSEPKFTIRPFIRAAMQEELDKECITKGIEKKRYDFDKLEKYIQDNNIPIDKIQYLNLDEFTYMA